MSVTAAEAFAVIRARLEASDSGIAIPLRWQGERAKALPDRPAAFAFVMFNIQGSHGAPIATGGGRGANVYRNRATVEAYTFVPLGDGLAAALTQAETIAARLRSYRDASISCWSADVIPVGHGSIIKPPGLASDVDNYQCAVAEIDLHFDQIG